MSRVVDASVVVAALIDSGPDGVWAEGLLGDGGLVAPHLMPVEVGNILRRASLAGQVSHDAASLAHADLLQLQVELFPYAPLAGRVWELRANLTAYDGWYVALAEALGLPLATLDRRLGQAPGPHCVFEMPPVVDVR